MSADAADFIFFLSTCHCNSTRPGPAGLLVVGATSGGVGHGFVYAAGREAVTNLILRRRIICCFMVVVVRDAPSRFHKCGSAVGKMSSLFNDWQCNIIVGAVGFEKTTTTTTT